MTRDDIKALLRKAFGPSIVRDDLSAWVSIRCPLAHWTHEKGTDANASAGVSVHDGKSSIFHCWGCNSKGTLAWLFRRYEQLSGKRLGVAPSEVDDTEAFGGVVPDWNEAMRRDEEPDRTPLDSREYLRLYDSAEGHHYLRSRGMPKGAATRLGLLLDPSDSRGAERILFPVHGRTGELFGFTGRATDDRVVPKVRDYHGLPKRQVLLGEHLISPTSDSLIVVEGLFDWAKLAYYSLPVVAALHAGLTSYQRRLLLEWDKPIVLMYDNDVAGRAADAAARKALSGLVPVFSCQYPNRCDGVSPKDPAACTRKEIIEMLEDAE